MADPSSKSASDRFLEVGGIRLHLNDVGRGPVILCTHGGGPGASAWGSLGPAVPALAEHFRLLLLDLPNFGESQTGVARGPAYPDVFLAHLCRDLLDRLEVAEPVSLLTSSGGSPAALRFAIDFPQRTAKLIIQAFAPGMRPSRDGPGHRATAAFIADPSRTAMAELFKLFTPNPVRRIEEAITARWETASVPGHLESRAEFATLAANTDITTELTTLAAEVLFVWGAEDRIVPVERVLAALQSVPRSQAHIWGDHTGHLVPLEHPKEFARVVTNFLSG